MLLVTFLLLCACMCYNVLHMCVNIKFPHLLSRVCKEEGLGVCYRVSFKKRGERGNNVNASLGVELRVT